MKNPKITKPVGVNKDGYSSGGVTIEVPSQNLHLDPRAKTSIRGRNYVAQGDKVTVRSTGGKGSSTKARKQKATWY